ncbi:MAG: hypothetical protein V4671_06415 [Armatimonadota bacterium]
MPLSVVHDTDGLYIPIVNCDWCGRHIESAYDGNYLYVVEEDGEPCSPVYFAHHECTEALETEKAGNFTSVVVELYALPTLLGNSLGLDLPMPEDEPGEGS